MITHHLKWTSADRLPDVPPGGMFRYLVTIEAANGKRRVEMANYANNHWLEWHDSYQGDDIDDDGGKRWTGWMEDCYDSYGDVISKSLEGIVRAWAEVPEPAI